MFKIKLQFLIEVQFALQLLVQTSSAKLKYNSSNSFEDEIFRATDR
jgi:hypothetical protein